MLTMRIDSAFYSLLGLYAIVGVLALGFIYAPLIGWWVNARPLHKVRSWWGRRLIRKLFSAGLLVLALATVGDGGPHVPVACDILCRSCLDAGWPDWICYGL